MSKISKAESPGEAALAFHLKCHKIEFEREVVFAPPRKWRFDFVLKQSPIAIEVNGGTWAAGRHNRGSSILAEYEKLNQAAISGYRVLQFTTQQVVCGAAIDTIRRAIA